MTLARKSALGPYEVISALGAGGMSEVFRARYKRPNRDVAVKALPKGFASNSDWQRRFEQESKTVAALNLRPCIRRTSPAL